jgi:indoleamine 2,3-dioxygenase
MVDTSAHCKQIHGVSDIMDVVNHQRQTLKKEVEKYCGERSVAAVAAS